MNAVKSMATIAAGVREPMSGVVKAQVAVADGVTRAPQATILACTLSTSNLPLASIRSYMKQYSYHILHQFTT